MAKNKSTNLKPQPISIQGSSKPLDNLILIIISCYLVIDCAPVIKIFDQMGWHWFLLSVLNLITGIFIFLNKDKLLVGSVKSVLKHLMTVLYFIFFLIAGLSIFMSINKIESLVIYTRLITTVTSFCVFGILFNQRLHLLKSIAVVVALIVFAKSFSAVMYFYSNVGKVDLNTLILSLSSSEGNKNIFAATLVVQIPLIVYGLFSYKNYIKYLFALSLGWALMSVFFINARSAYLGLIVELFFIIIGTIYLYYKNQKMQSLYLNGAILIATLLLTFFISENALNKASQGASSAYGTVSSRLEGITNNVNTTSSDRLSYWGKTIDFIKEKPILGVGYGNWKLVAHKYTGLLLNDNIASKHPHNDFLEIAGETGIPNCLIYLSIFAVAFFITIKTIFSKKSFETKLIAIIAFASLSGYFVDAFFNFPSERPHMQILFVFIIALIITNFSLEKEIDGANAKLPLAKAFCAVFILFGIFTVCVNYKVLKSLKAQYEVGFDLMSIDNKPDAKPKYTYEEVNTMLPSFPNIGENAETMEYKKAKYLQKEKRFDEAIKLLDASHKYSPYAIYDYFLKCNIYLEQGKTDSAYRYGKLSFYAKPRHFYYYRTANYLAAVKKDSNELVKMHKLYTTYRQDQPAYAFYARCLNWAGYNKTKLKKVVDDGLKLYPKDADLLRLKTGLP